MLRRLVERLTGPFTLTRRLPAEFGRAPVRVTTRFGLRYLRRDLTRIDPVITRFAAEFVRPGHVVWDVGTNLGVFSAAAAARSGATGMVLALEPDVRCLGYLTQTVARQPVTAAPITVLGVGVAGRLGVAEFVLARSAPRNSLAAYALPGGESVGRSAIVTVTLDWLAERFRPPGVLKIDVEGAEHEVLAGGPNTLLRHRPIVLCEVGEAARAEVGRLLGDAGYVLFDATQIGAARQPTVAAGWDTLAVPREKL